MGKFADLHKRWATQKKELSEVTNKEVAKKNKEVIKKNFNKDLGPKLDELDAAAESVLEARKAKFNPEKIASLSPKVEALCGEVSKIADKYAVTCKNQDWTEAAGIALKIAGQVHAHGDLEAKEWRPDKEYINLWKYATLEMALSAAGLEDAKTAEDLRKLLEKKNKDINTGKKDDKEVKETIEKLSRVWSKGADGQDYLKRFPDKIKEGVTVALKLATPPADKPADPAVATKLKAAVTSLRNAYDGLTVNQDRLNRDLKELKTYVKKPEVQNSASKQFGEDQVTMGDKYVGWYATAVAQTKIEIAKLPTVT